MIKTIQTDKTKKITHSPQFLALCERAQAKVTEISSSELQQRLSQTPAPIVIDVRDWDEVQAQGYLPGAVHVSKGWLEAHVHRVTPDCNAPLVLYCGSGKRSLLAALALQHMGYQQVASLVGGYKSWRASGLPTEHCDSFLS